MWELIVNYSDPNFVGNLLERMAQITSQTLGEYGDVASCNQALKDIVFSSAEQGWDIVRKHTNEYTYALNADLLFNESRKAGISCSYNNAAQYNGW